MSTTPQVAMEALLNLPKLECIITAEARQTAYRLRHIINTQQLRTDGHSRALIDLYKLSPILAAPNDHMQTIYTFERNFNIITPSRDEWETNTFSINYFDNVYFADGSKRSNGSGYGVYMANSDRNIQGECGTYASVTQTECIAIEVCCIDALQSRAVGTVSIYSDSMHVINALRKPKIDSSIIMNCFAALQELANTNETKIIWIPSNINAYGRIRSDRLAKTATDEAILAAEPYAIIDRSISKAINQNWLHDSVIKMWQETRQAEHTKSMLSAINPKISIQLLDLSKENIRIAIGLITGHCKVNSHLNKLRIRDDPDCDLCGMNRETAAHLLCYCQPLKQIRREIYGQDTIHEQEIIAHTTKQLLHFYHKCSENFGRIRRIFKT